MDETTAKPAVIPYGDFAKLDLRVAKIVGAEQVPDADKLYKLTLRIGAEERVIISGIADFYAPDELLGKKIIIIANLEPKKIRGLDSQGMLLAAVVEEGGKISQLALATIDNEMPDGAQVC